MQKLIQECNCYKCLQKREVGDFKSYFNNFIQKIGFKPEQFKFDIQQQFELDHILEIKTKIKDITKYNEEISTAPKVKFYHCHDCGRLATKSKTRQFKDSYGHAHHICPICSRERYRRCKSCGYLHDKFKMRRDIKGYKICPQCFALKYFKCNRCDNIFELEMAKTITTRNSDGYENNIVVCRSCAEYARTCTLCGTVQFTNNSMWSTQRQMCSNCFTESFGVKSHSYKPAPKFKLSPQEGTANKYTFLIGIEWELENRSRVKAEEQVSKITDVFKPGFLYFKNDGSLQNGFEVVSHPFSQRHWEQNKSAWERVLDVATEIKMVAEPTCGIHVHITKSAFTSGHLYKFSKFIYDRANRDFIIAISQRGGVNTYSRFDEKDTTGLLCFGKLKKNKSGLRYSAVNATGEKTVEVRLFASTNNKRDFFKNVEFIWALIEFSNTFGFRDMTVDKFMDWLLKERHNKYRNLLDFIARSGLFGTKFVKKYFKEIK